MATQFKCDKCGKMLSVGEVPGTTVVCPHCRSAIIVPSLGPAVAGAKPPKPRGRPTAKAQSADPQAQALPLEEEESEDDSRLVSVMGDVMPWAASVVFHVGLILMAVFILFGIEDDGAEPPLIPDSNMSANPGEMNPARSQQRKTRTSRVRVRKYKTTENSRLHSKSTKPKIVMIGVGIASGSPVPLGSSCPGGPSTGFFGTGGNARRVVWVVDRSGSMFDTFDRVRAEMKRSISKLKPMQSFHVVFFAAGEPEENPPKMLVPARGANKKQAYDYLDGVVAEGQTKPKRAIERAFAAKDNKGKHAQLIYMLTDGEFDPEIVKQIEKEQGRLKTKVKINTIAFIYRTGEKILKQIAASNGGTFQFVSRDDVSR